MFVVCVECVCLGVCVCRVGVCACGGSGGGSLLPDSSSLRKQKQFHYTSLSFQNISWSVVGTIFSKLITVP